MEGKNFNHIGLFLLVLSLIFTNFVCLYLLYQLHCQFEQQALLIEQQRLLLENLQTRLDLVTASIEKIDKQMLDDYYIKRMYDTVAAFYKGVALGIAVYLGWTS